jgi:integrase
MKQAEFFTPYAKKGGQKGDKMTKWKTAAPGIRYREHPTRKTGIRPDRYYALRFRIDGERVEEALGWLSEGWTLEKCKEARQALKNSAKAGGHRTMKERRTMIAAEAAAAPTFADMLAELWDKELSLKKSGLATKRLLEKDAIPAWGKRRVDSIKRRDIVLLLDTIEKRAPITRNRVHGALSRLFNFAAERGVIDDSPCTRIRKLAEKGRERTLNDEEIRALWDALDLDNMTMDAYRLTKLALKMILLTGQRPGEITGMAWHEIEGETWNIPAERMKGKEPHSVPLTGLALEVLQEAAILSADSAYVFRSTHRQGDRPMSAHALSRAILTHWDKIGISEKFTPHDLRRTVRTRLAELEISDVVAERVLGHKLQGIMAVYNRHPYAAEKRLALEAWERRLKDVVGLPVDRGKVVKMEGYRHA